MFSVSWPLRSDLRHAISPAVLSALSQQMQSCRRRLPVDEVESSPMRHKTWSHVPISRARSMQLLAMGVDLRSHFSRYLRASVDLAWIFVLGCVDWLIACFQVSPRSGLVCRATGGYRTDRIQMSVCAHRGTEDGPASRGQIPAWAYFSRAPMDVLLVCVRSACGHVYPIGY